MSYPIDVVPVEPVRPRTRFDDLVDTLADRLAVLGYGEELRIDAGERAEAHRMYMALARRFRGEYTVRRRDRAILIGRPGGEL